MTPLYPKNARAFIDEDFHLKSKASYWSLREEEKLIVKELEPVMFEFQSKGMHTKDQI